MATRIHDPGRQRLAPELIDKWRRVTSAVATDQLGGSAHLDTSIRPIRPLGDGVRLIGSAVTALCEPKDYGAVHHAIDVAAAGDVLVIAAGGRSDAAMIGELLSTAARLKGVAGVVLDGAVRDVATLSAWPDFQVFTRWTTPRGPSSMERGAVNCPVEVAGVKVEPFDLVIADDDGVSIVPHALAGEKLAGCLARVDAEAGWEKQLFGKSSTLEVFKVPAAVRD
ncbi:MAG: RraA family protein [Parvibaculaceae bacterium]